MSNYFDNIENIQRQIFNAPRGSQQEAELYEQWNNISLGYLNSATDLSQIKRACFTAPPHGPAHDLAATLIREKIPDDTDPDGGYF